MARFNIVRALWLTPSGRGADVTSQVQALVDSGTTLVVAQNETFGGLDPNPGTPKQLGVLYTDTTKPGRVLARITWERSNCNFD